MATIPDFTTSQLACVRRARDVDVQLQYAQNQIEELGGERSERLQSLKESVTLMREASKHPDEDEKVDLAGLIDDWLRREEEFTKVDREYKSQQKLSGNLERRILALLRASRQEDPELFASKTVTIADLLGDDLGCKPLTENGIDTVEGYLKARKSVIAQLVSQGNIPDDLIERADGAVYRHLEAAGILDRWPLDTPAGQQMRLVGEDDKEPGTAGEELCRRLEQHFDRDQPEWATFSILELVTTQSLSPPVGDDVLESVTDWVEERGNLPDESGYTAMHLLVDLAIEIVDFKPKGRQKLKIDGDPVPDAIACVFCEIERRHKEDPIEMYTDVVSELSKLPEAILNRLTFARALRERALEAGGAE